LISLRRLLRKYRASSTNRDLGEKRCLGSELYSFVTSLDMDGRRKPVEHNGSQHSFEQ
jgi:hypothetical protein